MTAARALAVLAALGCLAPLLPLPSEVRAQVPVAALLGGTALALTVGNPDPAFTRRWGRTLLQTSVVLLGFSMDLGTVARAGGRGFLFSVVSIAVVFGLGALLTRGLGVRRVTGTLVAAGTAICGGSAIAAVASVLDAPEEDTSVALGTVFLLNAVALLAFPPLGHLMGLSQTQFGTWAGIAIHDVASVVGAGTAYGPRALDVATATKLARVLFLVPIVLGLALSRRRANAAAGVKTPWPLFIGGFLLASLARTLVPAIGEASGPIKAVAGTGFALSLLFTGLGLSRASLRAVGGAPAGAGGRAVGRDLGRGARGGSVGTGVSPVLSFRRDLRVRRYGRDACTCGRGSPVKESLSEATGRSSRAEASSEEEYRRDACTYGYTGNRPIRAPSSVASSTQ